MKKLHSPNEFFDVRDLATPLFTADSDGSNFEFCSSYFSNLEISNIFTITRRNKSFLKFFRVLILLQVTNAMHFRNILKFSKKKIIISFKPKISWCYFGANFWTALANWQRLLLRVDYKGQNQRLEQFLPYFDSNLSNIYQPACNAI